LNEICQFLAGAKYDGDRGFFEAAYLEISSIRPDQQDAGSIAAPASMYKPFSEAFKFAWVPSATTTPST